MKKILLLSLVLVALTSQARFPFGGSGNNGIFVGATMSYPNFERLNSTLDINMGSTFAQPIQHIGLRTTFFKNTFSFVDRDWVLNYQMPINITGVNGNEASLYGFDLNWTSLGMDLLKGVKNVDFILGYGAKYGYHFMTYQSATDDEKAWYRNPMYGPKFNAELRVFLGPIGIGARAEYFFDWTRTEWLTYSENTFVPGRSKSTGHSLNAFIGYRIKYGGGFNPEAVEEMFDTYDEGQDGK